MVSNAGQDDGVPTSILKKLSFLQSLDHLNITKEEKIKQTNVLSIINIIS